MNKTQLLLLDLINYSQFGSSDNLFFEGVNSDDLYNEASYQCILGLVVPELPDELLNKRFKQVLFIQKAAYIRYCHAEDELVCLLNSFKIPFVIIKGNASALYYKCPSYRAMGDIDFYVSPDDFDRTKELLFQNGYIEEKDTERHISLIKDNVQFELHRHYSYRDIDIESYILDGLASYKIVKIDSHEFPMLPKLANGLVLLDHVRNHLKNDLGLRQVIDWMMYVYRELDDEFWTNVFQPIVKDKGMETLAIITTRMCQIYLGLPNTISWCKTADEKVCDQFIECVLSSGNFGSKNGQGREVEIAGTNLRKKGLFRWLQYAGEYNWKAYHKHHWLKPFCWFYQIFRYLKQGINTGRNKKQLKADLYRSKERYELLKKLGIE